MDDLKKTGAAAAVGAILAGGGAVMSMEAQVDAAQADAAAAGYEKQEVLKDYVYAQARLGELPELDTSIVDPEEMSAAYVAIAEEKGATEKPNLFEGLSEKAVEAGEACVPTQQ